MCWGGGGHMCSSTSYIAEDCAAPHATCLLDGSNWPVTMWFLLYSMRALTESVCSAWTKSVSLCNDPQWDNAKADQCVVQVCACCVCHCLGAMQQHTGTPVTRCIFLSAQALTVTPQHAYCPLPVLDYISLPSMTFGCGN